MVQRLNRLPVMPTRVLLVAALLLGTLLAMLQVQYASAQTHNYNVTSTADLPDATPGDDVCLTNTNVCTLRAAIEEANHPNNTGTKFIFPMAGTYTLNSQLVITGQNINIYGTGDSSNVIIDGGSQHRVFDVIGGPVGIFWVTIQNGRNEQSVNVPSHYHGGAIHNHGTLTLSEVVIQDSVADVVTSPPPAPAPQPTTDCVTVCGGGIYNAATVSVSMVTFVDNRAALHGGAILNGGTLAMENATLYSNDTFSADAALNGTGSAVANTGGTATLTHTTVASNSTESGGAIGVTGGTLTLAASIVANNTGGNCAGTITDGGFNIDYPDSACPGLNEDPLLDPAGPQDNGGSTPTIALLAASPAIDLIPSGSCTLTDDQRNVTRPSGAGCDAGAFEFVDTTAPTLTVSDVTVNATSPAGAVVNYQYTVSDDVTPSDQIVVVCTNAQGVVIPGGSTFPVGVTTLTCTATDASGNATQVSATVTVFGALELLDALRADTILLVGNANAERSLVSIVDLARSQVQAGRNFNAYAVMIQYVWQVSSYRNAGLISPATASQLMKEAGFVFDALL